MKSISFALMLIILQVCSSQAGIVFHSGSASFIHDAGFGGDTVSYIIDAGFDEGLAEYFPGASYTPGGIPRSPQAALNFNSSITLLNGNSSLATAGISQYYGADFWYVTLANGTGISQLAPAAGNTPATLTVNFSSSFHIGSGSAFNPQGSILYYNIPLYLSVPAGSSAGILGSLTTKLGVDSIQGYSETTLWNTGFQYTQSTAFNGIVNLYDQISIPGISAEPGPWRDFVITGQLTFFAKNDGGPVGITAPNGFTFSPISVPEPQSFLVLGVLAGFVLIYFRFQK